MRSGIVLFIAGILCVLLGIVFRLQHWPLAGFFFILSYALLPVAILVLLLAVSRHARFQPFLNSRIGQIRTRALLHVLMAFAVFGLLTNLGYLFKLQHWPLGTLSWWPFTIIASVLMWKYIQFPKERV